MRKKKRKNGERQVGEERFKEKTVSEEKTRILKRKKRNKDINGERPRRNFRRIGITSRLWREVIPITWKPLSRFPRGRSFLRISTFFRYFSGNIYPARGGVRQRVSNSASVSYHIKT